MKSTPSSPAPASAPKSSATTLFVVQAVCFVALLVWTIRLHRDLGIAREENAALHRKPAPEESLTRENRALRNQVAALENRLAFATTPAPAPASPAAPAVAPAPAPAAVTTAGRTNALADLLNNPLMRNQVAATQKRMLEARYADLFALFQFSPEQRQQFVDMISELQAPMLGAGVKLLDRNLPPEEQAALRKQGDEIEAATEARIRAFLGDEGRYTTYKQFMEQQPDRTQVNRFKQSLTQSGVPELTATQAQALTEILSSERRNTRAMRPGGGTEEPMAPTPELIASRAQEQSQQDERVANRAMAVLTPEQSAQLRRYQAQSLEATKLAAEAVRQITGAQPAAAK